MKLVIFGARGHTGREVARAALAAGHEVTSAVRGGQAATVRDALADEPEPLEKTRIVIADVLDAASVAKAVAGQDAVISTFGPTNNRKSGTLMSEGAKNIVAACEAAGVKRFVFESGLMTSDGSGLGFGARVGVKLVGAFYSKMRDDKRLAEATIRASSLDYVIVRPPNLMDGPAKRTYVHGENLRFNPMKKLSHADVADFLVKAASDAALARKTVEIGEP
jgi:uncharacterized protein YbjT (DUF2867 family)